MPEVFVSVGSNVDRERHIPSALEALRDRFGPLRISSVYETAAVGFEGDPFYNLVVGFETELPLGVVAAALTLIETDHGRTRDSRKFSARTLDLDLLLYGDAVISEGKLQLPRKELTEYAFMLEPLAEIAPDLKHPLSELRIQELWDRYEKQGLKQTRIAPPWPH
ncbi:MAG: 2-amino-4-hydroxy-6-hydroxymethyldihydropteridine diphosphokinase [Methylococcus sp.]|nr:2-amino-4-hydroxy-6-hydroxymethyldihydropteridine diphosphokinase [Methylococcus sp.]